jgi:hypothetical protein
MSDETQTEEQPDAGCQYCDNSEKFDLTTCGRCKTTFCIYCVGSGRVGYEVYDVCPNCGDVFDW